MNIPARDYDNPITRYATAKKFFELEENASLDSEDSASANYIIFKGRVNKVSIEIIASKEGKKPILESELTKRLKNKKIARILREYALFAFALWWGNNKYDDQTEVTGELLLKFSKQVFKIDPKHIYNLEDIPPEFGLNNNIIDVSGRITVQNHEIIKRLMYVVKTEIANNKTRIINSYKASSKINTYYLDISDFVQRPLCVLLDGTKSLARWIASASDILKTIDTIPVSFSEILYPFVLSSPSIEEGRLFLIQNVKKGSLRASLSVCERWKTLKLNSGYFTMSRDLEPGTAYMIYTQDSEGDFAFEKSPKDAEIDRLTYRVLKYDKGIYAAMLPLE